MGSYQIIPLKLQFSNAFLLKGEKIALVDTGVASDLPKLIKLLAVHKVTLKELDCVLLTHAHGDHVGNAKQIQDEFKCPIAIHPADVDRLKEGYNGKLKPVYAGTQLITKVVPQRFTPVTDNLTMIEEGPLDFFDSDIQVFHTPGHTPGSVSLGIDSENVLAGDLLIGGYLGGVFRSHIARYPYFADSLEEVRTSTKKLLAESYQTYYLGHGGPVSKNSVKGLIQG
ncbi:MBL fold metallo-hydrolase [Planctomycetales bacterium 10988]|nr:MBL fold metallo-hydrolase [Planctomycetales bacterium 10988]